MNALNFRNVGDRVGSVFILVGFDLSLKRRRTQQYKIRRDALQNLADLSESASRSDTEIPRLSGITCLLFVSLRILHIDQDLTAASFHSVHGEHSRLHHLVAMRLNTCNDTDRGYIFPDY